MRTKAEIQAMTTRQQYKLAYSNARGVFAQPETLDAEGKVAFIKGQALIGINPDTAAAAVTSWQIKNS